MNKPARDKYIKELDGKIGFFYSLKEDTYKESLPEQFILAKSCYEFFRGPDGIPDSRLFDDIATEMEEDIQGWILDLPFALADRASMVDEAVEIANLFAAVYSPDNFFGDMAVILAEAGRREEAFERIAKNLETFPDDVWVIIKAGQAHQALKETDKALELYNRAYGMTSPLSYDRKGLLERMVPLLSELGRNTEADALVESEDAAEKARTEKYRKYDERATNFVPASEERKPLPARSKKIGRNEPCPCGSGKKYKKCCGR